MNVVIAKRVLKFKKIGSFLTGELVVEIVKVGVMFNVKHWQNRDYR